MLRWSLFISAILFLAVASLTVLKAPNLFTWKLAILAGEYGHFLCLVPLAIAACSFLPALETSSTFRGLLVSICAGTVILFLRPTANAVKVARGLPQQFDAAFGKAENKDEPFTLGRLFPRTSAASTQPETRAFATVGSSGQKLSLDFYRANRGTSNPRPLARACVIVIHGGGWDNGERTQLSALNSVLAEDGYAVAAIDYRLAPYDPWPAQREDVLAALAYLKNNAAELGLDPTSFVLLGRSAGGQIAEAVAYGSPDPAIRGLIALYAPADLQFAWKYARTDDVLDTFHLLRQYLGGGPKEAPKKYDEASAFLHVERTSPPTLLVHGQMDTLVWHRQSARLAARLGENNVPHVFLDLPWATHALDFNLTGPGGQLSTYAIKRFLDSVSSKPARR